MCNKRYKEMGEINPYQKEVEDAIKKAKTKSKKKGKLEKILHPTENVDINLKDKEIDYKTKNGTFYVKHGDGETRVGIKKGF